MFTSKRIVDALSSPGVKRDIEAAAPTQQVFPTAADPETKDGSPGETVVVQNITGFVEKSKGRRLDRWLDRLVQASGSEPVFLLIVSGLVVWAFLGIPYSNSSAWAVIISDVQALLSYMFDSLLMRQQLNGYDRIIHVSASLRSRSLSHQRMLRQITQADGQASIVRRPHVESLPRTEFATELPQERLVGRISAAASKVMGHMVTVGLFWAGIFVWLGFGQSVGWSDTWQLYINSATSALMVLIFAFLANIREHHDAYVEKCLNLIFEVDSAVELKLRILTGDGDPNPTVVVPAPKVGKLQRAIFYYADVVGTLVGIAILIVVMVVWLCLGPVMGFSDNWWLLIGTYAGLVGLNDGFVLRNVQAHLNNYEDAAFDRANREDMGVFAAATIPAPEPEQVQVNSVNHRLSVRMGVVCAHEVTVVLGVLLIVGLIVAASMMKWTTTGQLLCNIPPSIIESFFMMILITGHNMTDARRRVDLRNMYVRRLRLLAFVDRLEVAEKLAGGP